MCVLSVKIWKYSYIFIIFCRLFWAFRAFYSAEGQLELLLSKTSETQQQQDIIILINI